MTVSHCSVSTDRQSSKSNNPIGGLGLTTGVLDAFVYGNVLLRVIKGGEPPFLLSQAASSRRDAWLNISNPESVAQLKRIQGKSVAEGDGEKASSESTSDFMETVKGLIKEDFMEGVEGIAGKGGA